MQPLVSILAVLYCCFSVSAQANFASIMQSSVGVWEGDLYYLDYQSGDRFSIPMKVEARLTPDNATLVRSVTYTDPGVLVYAMNLLTKDRDSSELVESYFRQGRGECFRYQLIEELYLSENEWRYIYQFSDLDDDRPAIVRHTVARKGKKMTSSKEVKFTDKPSEFILRNGTDLALVTN